MRMDYELPGGTSVSPQHGARNTHGSESPPIHPPQLEATSPSRDTPQRVFPSLGTQPFPRELGRPPTQ